MLKFLNRLFGIPESKPEPKTVNITVESPPVTVQPETVSIEVVKQEEPVKAVKRHSRNTSKAPVISHASKTNLNNKPANKPRGRAKK